MVHTHDAFDGTRLAARVTTGAMALRRVVNALCGCTVIARIDPSIGDNQSIAAWERVGARAADLPLFARIQ